MKKKEETMPADIFDMATYVEKAMRTDAPSTAELVHRMTDPTVIRLIHACLGMTSEVGELADMLKKHIFANKALDLVNAREELGDNLWYVALAIDVMQTTMAEIMEMNIEKLRMRYPERFCEEKSKNRDVDAEREFLETRVMTGDTSELSKRGEDWVRFSAQVLEHIENYTVPQYGDKGHDRASSYTMDVIADHIGRYKDRMGTNARGITEARRDMIKVAHYASLAMGILEEQ